MALSITLFQDSYKMTHHSLLIAFNCLCSAVFQIFHVSIKMNMVRLYTSTLWPPGTDFCLSYFFIAGTKYLTNTVLRIYFGSQFERIVSALVTYKRKCLIGDLLRGFRGLVLYHHSGEHRGTLVGAGAEG